MTHALIVEDDVTFASVLLEMAHQAGLKGVISTAGAGTLNMARKLQPDAITLDLGLADINGFVVIDDFQWADADSLALLRELVRRRNQAARSLGFRDYYAMALHLQELDEATLFGVGLHVSGNARVHFKTIQAQRH